MQAVCPNSNAQFPSPTRALPLQVQRFRAVLEWLISVPRWEDSLALAAAELELPGRRQGINRTAALRSMRIEQKYTLLRYALANGLETPSHLEARTLATQLGITTYKSRTDFERPSARQWQDLARRTQLKLSQLYSNYKDAQSELYSHYQKLPEIVTRHLCRSSVLVDDLLQEARLALLDAIDHINGENNFESYARHWMKRRIQNFMMQSKLPVSAPINLISKTLRRAEGGNRALEKAMREGTLTLDDQALEHACESDSSNSREKTPALDSEIKDLQTTVHAALFELTEKQREVIELRFGFDSQRSSLSLSEVATYTGISRQQVHQRERRALQRLAEILKAPVSELEFPHPLCGVS